MPENSADLTPWEQKIQHSQHWKLGEGWKFVYDEVSGQIVGYVQHFGGLTEMVNRQGESVFMDEISIQSSIISPIDFIGGGLARAFGSLLGRGVVSLSRFSASAGARKAGAELAASRLRMAAQTAAKQAAQAAAKQVGALSRREALIEAIVRAFPIYGPKARELCKYLNDGALMNVAKSLGVLPKGWPF
jgi:hypothetical protein